MYPIAATEDPAMYDICPFDPVHRILKSRMTTHISRCKNQHRDFKQCPFNSNHYSKNMEVSLSFSLSTQPYQRPISLLTASWSCPHRSIC